MPVPRRRPLDSAQATALVKYLPGLALAMGLELEALGWLSARQRKVTTWPLVQVPLGLKVVAVVPVVMLFS